MSSVSESMSAMLLKSADSWSMSTDQTSHSRVCAVLDEFSSRLEELTTALKNTHVENPSTEFENLSSELSWQLESARQLSQGLCKYPDVYRAMSAARIRAQCVHVCRSIGDALENLTLLLLNLGVHADFPDGYLDKLRDLAFAFRHLEYPLQSQDIMIRQKTKDWSSQVFTGQIRQIDGLIYIRDYLESVIGRDKIKDDWGKVSTFLLHDIYNAHSRDDPEEEHYLRLLFWALNGVDSPPPEYLCPISLTLMMDPVVLCESEVTYERQNITTWMIEDDQKICPVSQRKINQVMFIENAALKAAIANWQREQARDPEADSTYQETYDELNSSLGGSISRVGLERGVEDWDRQATSIEADLYSNPLNARMRSSDATAYRGVTSPQSNGSVRGYMLPVRDYRDIQDNSSVSSSGSKVHRQIFSKEISSQMFASAKQGNLDILMEIAGKDWDMSLFDESGRNALHLACIHGKHEVVAYLLDYGLSPNTTTKKDSSSPLILAATNGHSRCVEILLDRGADLVSQDARGWTALHCACDAGHRPVIQSLVKFGELRNIRYLDIRTESGWTVLHCAARKGDLDVFKFLLRFRCNINEPCKDGWSVLHIAVEKGHRLIVEEILRRPAANINAKSKDGWTALHSAVDTGDVDIGLLLVEKDIDVNATSDGGYTALHRAAFFNKLEFGKMLVEQGKADTTIRTKGGLTARDIAADKEFNEFHQYLFKRRIKNLFKPKKK